MAGTQTMRIQTLGSAEIIIGQTAVRPDSAVAFGLLLYLGLTAGERVPRARLVELFWPDQPETQSRHALRQLLYRLRRVGLPLAEGGEELRVDASVVECDAAPMLAPSWSATCGERDAMNASQFLTDFNPEISGPFSEWLDELRNRVARRYADASLRHLATARREARWSDVFDWSTRCLAVDPLNQDATYALAEATAMRGAKVEAVRILDEYSREIGALDGKVGLSTRVLRQRVSEAHGIDRPESGSRLAMVGRDAEIARLVRIVEDVARGQGGVTWISGAAGIGKSRLAAELRREAVIRGFSSMMIGLQSSDRQRPFSILSDMVAQLLKLPGALGCAPETLATLRRLVAYQETPPGVEVKPREPAVQQYEIREALVDLLGAIESEAPLMILIDDYHNGDASSVPILTDLIERTAASRVLWLMTSRPSVERPLFQLRATIELKPLPESACRQLVESTVPNLDSVERQRLTVACLQIAGGNPFFAREVIQFWDRSGGEKQLPSSVARAVTDQVSRLGEATTRVIQVIALLGSIATLRRVTRIMDCHVSELLQAFEELDSIGIVSLADDDAVMTVHDIWREEVLLSIRPIVRRVLHARIADVVEEEAQSVREATLFWQAAAHRCDSGSPALAVTLLQSCAQHMLRTGLPEEAADTLQKALEFCRTPEESLPCRRLRIDALYATGRWSAIQSEIAETVSISRATDARYDSHNDLELLSIESAWRAQSDFSQSLDATHNCGREVRASIEHRITALSQCAILADNTCNDHVLETSYRLLLNLCGENAQFRSARLTTSIIYNTSIGDLDAAISDTSAMLSIAREQDSIALLGRALRFASNPLRIVGDFPKAMELVTESLRLSERYRLSEAAAFCCDILATIAMDTGSVEEARSWTERTIAWARNVDTEYWRLSTRTLRAKLALASDDPAAALMEMGSSTESFSTDPMVRQGLGCLSIVAGALRQQGRRDDLLGPLGGMRVLFPRIIRRGRLDSIVEEYVRSLVFAGMSLEAKQFLDKYLSSERRDRHPNHRLASLCRD
jgi:DNA-binding SARP family transcriptional activator/tetratricopeptide (TPR) repeat protein